MIEKSLTERTRHSATNAARFPTVAILMATYNGANHINEQLNSFSIQTLQPYELHVSDDGSRDATLELVKRWAVRNPSIRLNLLNGPQSGFAENFRHLLTKSVTNADFVAFSDQDDVWLDGKLEAAVRALAMVELGIPAMYCGRTLNFPTRKPNAMSPLFTKPPSFANALVQSIAGGNTIVLNRAAFELVRQASSRSGFVSHDWWCYLLISGAGGQVLYSAHPMVKYRQHEGNLVGANNDLSARLQRVGLLFKGRFRRWTDQNIEGLNQCRDLLLSSATNKLDQFSAARNSVFWQRPYLVAKCGLYRQTWQGQIGLYAATLLGLL